MGHIWGLKMQTRHIIIIALVALAGILYVCLASSKTIKANYYFFRLKLSRQNSEQAKPYMQILTQTKEGIDICMRDISICYSQTRGLSSWVVRNAVDSKYAISRLYELVKNGEIGTDVLVEANLLIWEMARDTKALRDIYKILSNEANKSSDIQRNILLVFSRGALIGKVKDEKKEDFTEKYEDGSLWGITEDEFVLYFDTVFL